MDASQNNDLEVSKNGDNQVPISVLSSGHGSDLEIINQYGQLVGDFSKLDDELWLSSPEDDQFLHVCDEDLQTNNILSSHEHAVLEPLWSSADNSAVNMNSSILKTCPQNDYPTLSPVTVLVRRPYSNATVKTMKRTRSKRCRPAKGQPRCSRFSSTEADQSKYAESLLWDEAADSFSPEHVRTRKLSDLIQFHSGEKNQNPNFESAQQLNLNVEPRKTCMHCESATTPQWRDGPMGPKTLCNACGIQFKFGRLSADYRPLKSPTFDPSQHTNMAKNKRLKFNNYNLSYGSSLKRRDHIGIDPYYTPNAPKIKHIHTEKKVQEMRLVDCGVYQNRTPKPNSIMEMADYPGDLVEPGSRLKNDKCEPKHILKKKLAKHEIQKCLHCESTKTPQWRQGPMGRNTLCNACGVQHKHGRLFPEYRPLMSPTYDPSLHSHSPKKVLEMRMRKAPEECAVAGDSEQTVPSNNFSHLFRVH